MPRQGSGYEKSSSRGAALMVGDTGIEPVTSSVSGKRATAAPIARNRKDPEWSCVNLMKQQSGRRDSNSRHPPWQGGALPAELRPQYEVHAGLAGGAASSKFPCFGGRYWDRTSDLFRVREARYRCANRPFRIRSEPETRVFTEVGTGFEPVYTALQAAASPLGQPTV